MKRVLPPGSIVSLVGQCRLNLIPSMVQLRKIDDDEKGVLYEVFPEVQGSPEAGPRLDSD
jgi:hypothetical protein